MMLVRSSSAGKRVLLMGGVKGERPDRKTCDMKKSMEHVANIVMHGADEQQKTISKF